MKTRAAYIFIALITIVLAALSVYIINGIKTGDTQVFAVLQKYPAFEEKSYESEGAFITERTVSFEDGALFSVLRFEFTGEAALFSYELPVSGSDLNIKWQDYGALPGVWADMGAAVPMATLFAETSEESVVLSVPALYYKRFNHNTVENMPDSERPAVISEVEGGYVFSAEFEAFEDTVGELWFYKSSGRLLDWDDAFEALMLRQDLHLNRRFCLDGYYFRTYESYSPYSENGFFRNPANFTGAQLLSADGPFKDIGYAMTKICLLNQNPYGYWETGPMSEWLYNDYGIGYGFYDTRFSTDFARSLLEGYNIYGDADFLEGALKYAEFLTDYAEREGYKSLNNEGILVPDYWGRDIKKKTHVSLNHQLAEMNFLIEAFNAAGTQKYEEYALKLLMGIEETAEEWIMEDGNLKYALMYEDTSNIMLDYPYLTYNDLFEARLLLEGMGKQSRAIEVLMASKREWMVRNGVTGYKK